MAENSTGAFVLLDALGFKGITTRRKVKARAVVEKLRSLRDGPRTPFSRDPDRGPLGTVRVAFITDSVAIVVKRRALGELRARLKVAKVDAAFANWWALREACIIASQIQQAAVEQEPDLVYRGCVSFGPVAFKEDFYAGLAVDRAAASERCAEGAIIWLDDYAERAVMPQYAEPFLLKYAVPMKSRCTCKHHVLPLSRECVPPASRERYVVSPFVGAAYQAMPESLRRGHMKRLLAAFETHKGKVPPEAETKLVNTRAFLDAASQAIAARARR